MLALLLSASMSSNSPAYSASNSATGTLEVTTGVNGHPSPANIRVSRSGNGSTVYWTLYQPGGPALPTPLRIPLAVGHYTVDVRPGFIHALESKLSHQVRDIDIKAGATRRERFDFQAAHLRVSAHQANGDSLRGAAIAIGKGQLDNVTGSRYRQLPAEFVLSPGRFTLQVEDTKDHNIRRLPITLHAGQIKQQNVIFGSAHVGTLAIDIMLDGTPAPPARASRYVKTTILSAQTHQVVRPLSGGYGRPMVLPSGDYEVDVHLRIIGADDRHFDNIHIIDGGRVTRRIDIKPPGSLTLRGRWSGQPSHLADCIRYHNLFNPARLGSLMGGHSASRGECPNPVIDKLVIQVTDRKGNGNKNNAPFSTSPIYILPGTYQLGVWPEHHPELRQSIERLTVTPGATLQRRLEFRWPDAR